MQMLRNEHSRYLYLNVACLALLIAAAGATRFHGTLSAQSRGGAQAPRFEVDPLWPKPLPNHWILGSVTGVAVDSQDHVWVTHRGIDSLGTNEKGATLTPAAATCCSSAPQIL